jgi:hypothetical protein
MTKTKSIRPWRQARSGGKASNELELLKKETGLTEAAIRSALEFAVAMEDLAPPPPSSSPDAPQPAVVSIIAPKPLRVPNLESVATFWMNSCAGGDSYDNNCAHFLSDAFLRAGYSELLPSAACVSARCATAAKRPIRAREMWCWFQQKKTSESRKLQKGTGWWAVFQLNEKVYWGGHVVLFDSDQWTYYGTGWYPDWDQYLYKW